MAILIKAKRTTSPQQRVCMLFFLAEIRQVELELQAIAFSLEAASAAIWRRSYSN
jgi:hypothetical protein